MGGKNPYYLTLRLSANISTKSSAHNFEDIHLIFRVRGDICIFRFSDQILVTIQSLVTPGKIMNNWDNPYYLTLRLSANISKKSNAHNFGYIVLILCLVGDIDYKIKWSNLGENRMVNHVWKK